METNTVLMIILIFILILMLFRRIRPPPPPPPVPMPYPVKPIGGCAGTRYGCCPNGVTPRMDAEGSNC